MILVILMVKVAGIDPGTKSFDIVCIDGDRVVYEKSLETVEVARNPDILIDAIDSIDVDYIVAPSGYGVPVTRGGEVLDPRRFATEILLLSSEDDIKKGVEAGEIGIWVYEALAKTVEHLVNRYGNRVLFIPSIIQLPTVPFYRKINRIDMGTVDKLAATFLAIYKEASNKGIDYSDVNIIVVELGFGYNATIAVRKGKIVDGIGGTVASIGTLTSGAIDLEVASHSEKWYRWDVFYGGIFHIAKKYDLSIFAEAYKKSEEPMASLFIGFIEGVAKDIARMSISVPNAEKILLTGRHSRIPLVIDMLKELIPDIEVERSDVLKGASISKEAGQGYAAIGEGIVGEKFTELVKHIEIEKACGTVVDYIYHPRAEEFKKRILKTYRDVVKSPKLCI